MGDARSVASEQFALRKLGIRARHVVCTESELQRRFAHRGVTVPEVISRDPTDASRVLSVEVKRIPGNTVPRESTETMRRMVRNRTRIIWPWEQTICHALKKANSDVIEAFGVNEHYIAVVYPSSLPSRQVRRLIRHTHDVLASQTITCRVRLFFFEGSPHLFDRLVCL